jgi:aminoglycoside phosphotransferase (APT) family kinase protein
VPPSKPSLSQAQVTVGLQGLCRARTRDRAARVTDVRAVGGHAGLTLGFDLQWKPEGRPERNEALILRLAPPGVRAAGPADVVRQARLLRCLSSLGVPVPRVRWFGSDTRYFGTPFHVVERVKGRTFGLDEPDGTRGMGDVHKVGRDAIRRLAELHRVDPTRATSVLGEPLDLQTDIARWDRFIERAGDPQLVVDVPDLRSKLRARIPRAPRIGILHGDYQWSNVLVRDERIAAMLDWELAAVGPVWTDLGWLCLFSDPECWAPPIVLPPLPSPLELVSEYARQSGDDVDEIDWYRAHAAYKFGIIAALNLGLHLRGKRHDPFWEQLAPSVPRMITRGIELLST